MRATPCLAALVLAAAATGALANTGSVAHVAGTLSAKKADGTTRLLAPRSEVRTGDIVSTERDWSSSRPISPKKS